MYLCSGKVANYQHKRKRKQGYWQNLSNQKDRTVIQMTTFIGNISVRLDSKGRFFIPASYRKILAEWDSERIVMRRDTDNACLIFYPEKVWNARVEQLSSTLDEWNAEDQMLLMQFVAEAAFLEPDSQGRVLLQKRDLQQIGADGELLIVGIMNRFAIWSKQTFESKMLKPDEFALQLRKRMTQRGTKE